MSSQKIHNQMAPATKNLVCWKTRANTVYCSIYML